MAEPGIPVDHSTAHRGAIKLLPALEKAFCQHKRPVGNSWRIDETYIRLKGEGRYLYRAVDKDGNAIDFLLHANLAALYALDAERWGDVTHIVKQSDGGTDAAGNLQVHHLNCRRNPQHAGKLNCTTGCRQMPL